MEGQGLLTAEAGSGKTAALRTLCDALPGPEYCIVYICDTSLTPAAVYRNLAAALGLKPGHHLILAHNKGQSFVDEQIMLAACDELELVRPSFQAISSGSGESRGKRGTKARESRGMVQRSRYDREPMFHPQRRHLAHAPAHARQTDRQTDRQTPWLLQREGDPQRIAAVSVLRDQGALLEVPARRERLQLMLALMRTSPHGIEAVCAAQLLSPIQPHPEPVSAAPSFATLLASLCT